MSKKNTFATIDPIEFELDYKELQLEFAEDLAKDIRQDAPKDTGDYEEGINATQSKLKDGSYVAYVSNTDPKEWPKGHLLEFGTVKMEAQPHYEPNAKKSINKYTKKMQEVNIKERK